jgi:phage FluMu protein Com
MTEIRCPKCKRLLGRVKFEGRHLAIEAKCPRCSTVVDYKVCTDTAQS